MSIAITVPIVSDHDILVARQVSRKLARDQGFNPTDATLIATATSEVARHILTRTPRGEIMVQIGGLNDKPYFELVARYDSAEGRDVPGPVVRLDRTKRIMDSFDVTSKDGRTTIRITKYLRVASL